jgi:predicted PurR-regulated permease PerM
MGKKIFAAIVFVAFVYLTASFLLPLAMGGILAVLLNPWVERLEKRRLSRDLSSAIVTFSTTIFVLIPLGLIVFFLAKSAINQVNVIRHSEVGAAAAAGASSQNGSWVQSVIETPRVHAWMETLTKWFPVGVEQIIDTVGPLQDGHEPGGRRRRSVRRAHPGDGHRFRDRGGGDLLLSGRRAQIGHLSEAQYDLHPD